MVTAQNAGTAADALMEPAMREAEKTEPRKDTGRDTERAIVEDADKTDGADRDLVHGDGGTLGLPTNPKPKDLGQDD